MDTERPLKMQGLESETSGRSEKHGEAMEHEGSPVSKKEKERDKERHHHHHRHHHRGREREKDRAREKKHHHKHSSKEKQRSSERMSTGIVSLSVDQTALPLSPSTDNASDQVQSVRPSAVVDQSHDVQSRLVQQGAEEETEKETGEISAEEGEIREDGELQVEVFMDVQETEPPVADKASFLPKKRKHSPATQELEEKHVRSKISVDVLHSSVGDAFHTDEFESQGLHGESRKISRVRKSSNSHKSSRRRKDLQDVKDGCERSRRSRSKERESTKRLKESESFKSLTEVDGLDRKRRSRSQTREKLQIRKEVNITDRKRRSKSRDILPVRKEEDNSDRRRRSKSRESVRERKHDESLDGKLLSKSKGVLRVHNDDEKPSRRRSQLKESLRECRVNDQDLSRHVPAEIQESRREDGSKGQVDSVDRKPRSGSRETLREPRIEGSVDRKVQGERAGRRRRSRSRESLRDRRVEEVFDRKGRSRSRESVRDREGEDREARRTAIRGDDSMNRSRRHEHESGRHGRVEEIPDKVKDGRRHSRADSSERKRRSLSRESLRERRGGSRSRDQANDFHDRSIRHGWRANDGRSHFDGQDGRNGNLHNGGRDRPYGSDRHRDRDRGRDGGYGNHQDRDRSDRTYQNRGSRYDSHKDKEETPREEDNEDDYQERIETQLAAQEEDDVERIKEESRRRRQAILEKYKQQHEEKTDVEQPPTVIGDQKSGGPGEVQNGASPSEITGDMHAVDQTPVLISVTLEKGNLLNGSAVAQALPGTGGLGDGSPESEHSADMFCDDIFGESPAGERRVGKVDGLAIDTSGLTDNWDDAEGRYCFRIGEVLDGRYEVLSSHGSGVFSTVVRARDMKAGRYDPDEVAIKIIRNNETMFRTGQQELVILRKLAGADPENRRHCVWLLSSFEYRNHLCLVFESLHMNLREILKKFGRNIGINLTAVRAYAKQLFIALKHLRNCGVLHCDIKPDNMLVNDAKNVLKLCDFGSAMFAGENEITPYLVSRFYRAPEIILGLPYDHALDVWSVGCCLYELYSGKMLFPGHTNNDMLRLQMELKGPFPKKMLKKAKFTDQHFDQDYNFCAVEEDPVTKKMVKRIVVNVKPKDMAVLVASSGTVDEDSRIVGHFKDMLEKIFILDPDKRMTVSQALNHPFISGK